MTISISINDEHDIFLDDAGNLSLATDLQACLQDCKTAVLAQRGEMIYAMDEGLPTREIIWDSYRPAQFEAAARNAIMSMPGVLQVTQFSMTRQGDTFGYNATIETQWGKGTING
ncbi:hypothetical protein FHU10_5145 [Serratia fonticola]|jgi:hypothetical protein|uniref:Phage protein n=1 Tax=Serratia fonticola TaxID=47917 RepID=A0A542BN46_SERFO|nr:hypothetical protein [Serratia fonticola]TQI80004.1 hypothetical protein FHU09_2559 [Serratia fonticola]TQI97970.1 hypothetical protein FHU11_3487 [Serratia fonticola]TVZ72465.1 hypothetical protein FHU10_5145 [Serratia fonticola]